MPIVLAEFEKRGKIATYGWLNLTFPPKLSSDHILLRGKTISNDFEKTNFINIIEEHFDEIWKVSKEKYE